MTQLKEIDMNTSAKLAALAVALLMNSLIIGGVALMFNSQLQHAATMSLVHTQPSLTYSAV